ncbi:MAG: hypothetical protein DMG98_16515 [Acidobacteria bacterium]|nr:MAG: hypothetical protein DMG98_16515 [Acidobacteriota bacterium]
MRAEERSGRSRKTNRQCFWRDTRIARARFEGDLLGNINQHWRVRQILCPPPGHSRFSSLSLSVFSGGIAQKHSTAAAIHAYLQPYAQSGNFSGDVLVVKSGKIIFERAYGFADREHHIRNTATTRFHIASMSMQFTAAAVLRLVDIGSMKLDDHVGGFVPGIQGADKITLRDLLTERSGLPDINALPNYDDVLQHHQTPSSLIAEIEGRPLLFEPG